MAAAPRPTTRPGHRLGLRRGPARDQPLPRLFATHYHELAVLEQRLAYVANLSLKAKEWNGDLIFLHEAGPGPADRSFHGVAQVAKLAGVPGPVVARARDVLERLERDAAGPANLDDLAALCRERAGRWRAVWPERPAEEALRVMEPDGMSPREAMDALYRLKALLD